jgi:uncharacterized FlaG/YvyC family protein
MGKKSLLFLILFLGIFFSGEKVAAASLDFSITLPEEAYHLDATLPIAVTMKNSGQENIQAGSKIVLDISSELLNFNTLYLDASAESLFKISAIPSQNKIEIITQKEIGRANINLTLFGRIRSFGGEYDIASHYQDTADNTIPIMPNIKKIKVINNDVKFGLLNLYWGYEPTNTGTFLGKDPTAEDNLTGLFSNITNEISNQMNINRGHTDILENDEHYTGNLEFKSPTPSTIHFEEDKLEVTDLDTHQQMPRDLYTVKIENNDTSAIKITVDFLSPQQSDNQIEKSHAYNIKYVFTVDDLKQIYESAGQVQIENQTDVVKETNIFYLHSKLAVKNKDVIFPIIKADDKTFDPGQLTKTNLMELLMENISASDPAEGDLSSKIKIDPHNLLQVADTPGTYSNIVKYSVTNDQGLKSEKSISVTITKLLGTVTIDYIDQNGKKIKNSDTIKGIVGTPYQLNTVKIKGWKLISSPIDSKGTFSKNNQTVEFIYEKEKKDTSEPVKTKKKDSKNKEKIITIYYKDENGDDISAPKTIKGMEGTSYKTSPLKLEGWEIKAIPNNHLGVFSSETKDIIFVYKKIEFGTVVIRYLDKDGHRIKNDEEIQGRVGKPYDFTEKQKIENMDLVKIKGNIKGSYQKEKTFITFYYKEPTGTVIIKFVDENGKEITPPKHLQGKIGEKYSYIPKKTILD